MRNRPNLELFGLDTDTQSAPEPRTWNVNARFKYQYTARELVYAIRHAKSHPNDSYRISAEQTLTAAEYLAWFRRVLHQKISRTLTKRTATWRKMQYEYQTELLRDEARLRGYGGFGKQIATPEIRRKLGADHVHFYVGGRAEICRDPECCSRPY